MTERVDGKRLGRRPPSNKPAIMFANILSAVAPAHAGQVDNFASVDDWGLYGNDAYGVCGPVSVANSLKLLTKIADPAEVSVTQADVFDLYRRSGNPNFDPATDADDNGVVMQDMLNELIKGGIGERKPLAFAKVDVTNLDEVRAAIDYFGCVLFGVNLEVAQQAESNPGGVWDYHSSGEWGGHAIVSGKYTSQNAPGVADFYVVSWGEVLGVTDSFCSHHQLEEAWVVVWPEHLTHPAFRAGVDVTALAVAYQTMTGRPFPAVLPPPEPPPGPTPPPVPDPGAAPFPGCDPVLAQRIVALAARRSMTTSEYLNWFLGKLLHLGDPSVSLIEQLLLGDDATWG